MPFTFPILSDDTFRDKMDAMTAVLAAMASSSGTLRPKSFTEVQAINRMGLADKALSVGDWFTVANGDEVNAYSIIGIDQDTPVDKTKKHSITLQAHNSLLLMQLDAPEALYYAATGLSAGTYNFTLDAGFAETLGGGKTYQFTLTQPVPTGGQIVFLWVGDTQHASTANINTYPSNISTTAIETVPVTEGGGGTALSPTNHTGRVRYGSNKYSESAVRQWLNSDKPAGSVWTPASIYDRPPAWASVTPGFLHGMDKELVSVLGNVKKTTLLSSIDGGGSTVTNDKVFLLSRSEVYGQSATQEGEAYAYYSGNSQLAAPGSGADANRIKYRDSALVAVPWALRSAQTAEAYNIHSVQANGGISGNTPRNMGVAPAFCIV